MGHPVKVVSADWNTELKHFQSPVLFLSCFYRTDAMLNNISIKLAELVKFYSLLLIT